MSAVATAYVWANSKATGSGLLVLLAIADAANQECENSYQSVATLCRMARVSETTVHRVMRDLLEAGEVEVTGTHPQYGTKIYRLSPSLRGGAKSEPPQSEGGATGEPEGVPPTAPEPSTNPTTTTTTPGGGVTDRRQARPIPTNWRPHPDTVTKVRAEYPNVDHRRAHERYVNHHRMKGTRAVDWDAGFVMWVQADDERRVQSEPPEEAVKFDDVTGMPINPKPMEFAPSATSLK